MRKTFWGAVITLWFLVASILTDLTEDVVNLERVINFDKHFAALFLSWRSVIGVKIFSAITFLANLEFALPLVAIILLILIFKKYQTYIWPFLFTVISAELVTFIGKLLVRRIRPEDGALVMLDFSFPSGHATIAVALYGFLAYLLFRKTKQKIYIFSAFVLILLLGFSRLYLGVHYVTDVIAGYLVGLLALMAGISLREWLFYRQK